MKHLSLILLLIAVSVTSKAQNLGVFGGASYNNVITDDAGSKKAQLGYRAGVAAHLNINETLQFRYGFGYSTRYYRMNVLGSDIDYKYTFADILLLGEFKVVDDLLNVFVGPVLAINMDNNFKTSSGDGKSYDVKNLYPMLQVGVNLHLPGFPEFGLDVYYERGFNGLVSHAQAQTTVTLD